MWATRFSFTREENALYYFAGVQCKRNGIKYEHSEGKVDDSAILVNKPKGQTKKKEKPDPDLRFEIIQHVRLNKLRSR